MGDDNVVLHYKPQGADDDKTGLKSKDFLIVLQTPIQAEMLKKFAEGKVVICIQGGQNGTWLSDTTTWKVTAPTDIPSQ